MVVEHPVVFNPHNVQRWHVGVEANYVFARDETNVWVAARTRDDLWRLKPVQFEWERVPEGVARTEPSMVIPNELGQSMVEAAVPRYVGTDVTNVVTKIRDLERQRDKAQQQLDNLIAGIGRLGASPRD